jgi:hypothetical protein
VSAVRISPLISVLCQRLDKRSASCWQILTVADLVFGECCSFLFSCLLWEFPRILFDFCSMSEVGQEIGELLADFDGRGSGFW